MAPRTRANLEELINRGKNSITRQSDSYYLLEMLKTVFDVENTITSNLHILDGYYDCKTTDETKRVGFTALNEINSYLQIEQKTELAYNGFGRAAANWGTIRNIGSDGLIIGLNKTGAPIEFATENTIKMALKAEGSLVLGEAASVINEDNCILKLDSTTKGFRAPLMTTTERNAIGVGASDEGLEIWNTTTKKKQVWDGTIWNDCF